MDYLERRGFWRNGRNSQIYPPIRQYYHKRQFSVRTNWLDQYADYRGAPRCRGLPIPAMFWKFRLKGRTAETATSGHLLLIILLWAGVCAISKSCGEVNTIFDISGKRFGTVKEKVIFKNNNPLAIPLETEADITAAVWSDESIIGVEIPAGFADGNYSVLVRLPGPPVSNSNSLPFDKPVTRRHSVRS